MKQKFITINGKTERTKNMNKIKLFIITAIISTAILTGAKAFCEISTTMPDIKLPTPNMTGGTPIMDAYKNRKTSDKFSKKPIDLQLLSDLLWAADGQNRPDGKRTAPSALNAQVISIYAAFPDGVYKYDPSSHTLNAFSKEDIRPIVGKYPLILLYAADLSKQSKYLASVDCGFIGQNVYLFSAANKLNTAFLYGVNSIALSAKLGLKLGQEVLFAQIIGYPPEVK